MRRRLAAGNWKMHGLSADLDEARALARDTATARCERLICPPATLLAPMAAALAGSGVLLGGQDCHHTASGAHTGDVSAAMLADAGASHVIVGHSERRSDHGETDDQVATKAAAAHAAGLVAIICLGETEAERDRGQTLAVVSGQLAGSLPDSASAVNTVIAYEPVWAIGTGRTPTEAQIAEVHAALRGALQRLLGGEGAGIRLLYGGSVKPGNAAAIFALPEVDGALVGGASLKAADFAAIVSALDSSG